MYMYRLYLLLFLCFTNTETLSLLQDDHFIHFILKNKAGTKLDLLFFRYARNLFFTRWHPVFSYGQTLNTAESKGFFFTE